MPTTLVSLENPPAIISLRNYRHLVAHRGHDLTVTVYGSDQSAALECETCRTILIAFENTPGPDADLMALLALTRRHRIEPCHLAPHLAGVAQQQANALNERGLNLQVEYLLATLGTQQAHEVIERIAASPRTGTSWPPMRSAPP